MLQGWNSGCVPAAELELLRRLLGGPASWKEGREVGAAAFRPGRRVGPSAEIPEGLYKVLLWTTRWARLNRGAG